MTVLPRAATAPELALFRTNGQWSKLSLFVYTPATVYSGRVSAVPVNGNDQVRQIAYSSGSGTLADVLPDMTMMVGTTAGGWDKGFCRVRSIDSTNVYIGETSEIQWAVGQYLTIVADWEIWLRKLSFMGGVYNLDNEIPYTNQYTDPIPQPVLGPYLAAVKLVSSTVTLAMDASNSWVPGGSITGYSWAAKGPASVTFSSAAIAAPTLTFSAVGTYRIACTVTTGTQTNTGYRLVHVYSAASPLAGGFVPGKVDISREAGGSFTVDLYDSSAISSVRPRALVALVAEDHYGDTIQSIGCVPGYENVVMIGRISGENITWNAEQSRVTFTVQGPGGQLQVTPQWPFTLMDTHAVKPGSSPLDADWLHMPDLTVDKSAWCWANWRSTMGRCMDVYPSGDTRREYSAAGNLGSSWDQLKSFMDQIGGFPGADRYGRLFVEVDPNLLSGSDRAAIPTVMEISKADWVDEIALERREYAVTGWMQTTGYIFNGSNFDAMLSAAPGNALGMRGNSQTKNNLLLSSQTQSNELAGLLLAKANNEYPSATITLAGHNRLIDIAPAQYVTLTLAAGDTPYGISFASRKFIPKRVSYTYDPENGMFVVSVEAEGETTGPAGVTVIPPSIGRTNIIGGGTTPHPFGGGGSFPWPPYIGTPPPVTPPTLPPNNACLSADLPTGPFNLWTSGAWLSPDPSVPVYQVSWNTLPSTIRAQSSSNKSLVELTGTFWKKVGGAWVETLDYGQFEAVAGDSSFSRLLVAVNQEPTDTHHRRAVFTPPAPVAANLYYFNLLPAGYTAPTVTYPVDPSDTLGLGWTTLTDWPGYTGEAPFSIASYSQTLISLTSEINADGQLHITHTFTYSFFGYAVDFYHSNRDRATIVPRFGWKVPDAAGTTFLVRGTCFLSCNEVGLTHYSAGSTIYHPDKAHVDIGVGTVLTDFYHQYIRGTMPTATSGNVSTCNALVYTSAGQYAGNHMIWFPASRFINPTANVPFTGTCTMNVWISYNDGQEYKSDIESAYLWNVCPA